MTGKKEDKRVDLTGWFNWTTIESGWKKCQQQLRKQPVTAPGDPRNVLHYRPDSNFLSRLVSSIHSKNKRIMQTMVDRATYFDSQKVKRFNAKENGSQQDFQIFLKLKIRINMFQQSKNVSTLIIIQSATFMNKKFESKCLSKFEFFHGFKTLPDSWIFLTCISVQLFFDRLIQLRTRGLYLCSNLSLF